MTTLIIDDLVNDLNKKRLVVTLKWEGNPQKAFGAREEMTDCGLCRPL